MIGMYTTTTEETKASKGKSHGYNVSMPTALINITIGFNKVNFFDQCRFQIPYNMVIATGNMHQRDDYNIIVHACGANS